MLPSVVQGQVHVPCPKSQVHKPDFNLLFPLHLFSLWIYFFVHATQHCCSPCSRYAMFQIFSVIQRVWFLKVKYGSPVSSNHMEHNIK
jgi:hypothetical protein